MCPRFPRLQVVNAIGRLHHVVHDAREPLRDAQFWSALLGQPITYRSEDWVVVATDSEHSGMAFQLIVDHEPPVWKDRARQRQLHHDVMVNDVREAEERVQALGARPLRVTAEHSIWADPAGHPFCLIPRPTWAEPINQERAASS